MAIVGFLRHVSSDLAEFITIKAERDKPRERVVVLEVEKHKFEDCYDLLVMGLDVEMKRLSR